MVGTIQHNWIDANNNWQVPETVSNLLAASQVVAAWNQTGGLEIFAIGSYDDALSPDPFMLWRFEIDPKSGKWNEIRFEGDSATMLAVANNQDERIELFYIGTNGRLYHNWQLLLGDGAGWSGEHAFSNDTALSLTAIQNEDGRIELIYIGSNGRLYHNWQVTSNGNWAGDAAFDAHSGFVYDANFNHVRSQALAAVSNENILQVFYRNENGERAFISQTAMNNGWGAPQTFPAGSNLSGQTAGPAVFAGTVRSRRVLWQEVQVELFECTGVISAFSPSWEVWPTQSDWQPDTNFETIGGIAETVAATCEANGTVRVFAVIEGTLYCASKAFGSTQWTGFVRLDHGVTSIYAAVNPQGRSEIFYC